MSLAEKISNDFKKALKSREKIKVSVLRMIKATIKNKEIEKGDSLSDDEIMGVLKSFVKRTNESIEQFSKGGRSDLVEKEQKEQKIIQDYLPKQLGEDEISKLIKDTISEVGATGSKDMGTVMKTVMAKAKGQVDGKLVNNIVKSMLEA
jgi:uncharacterized protein YqeY